MRSRSSAASSQIALGAEGAGGKEKLLPYAVFTNEQRVGVAKACCATTNEFGKIDGVEPARIEKYDATPRMSPWSGR